MIRKYADEDKEAVVLSWRAASELAHPFLTPEFLDKEAEALREVYLAFAETWVSEIDGEVVGFIAMIDTQIGGLFVRPEHHGQGLGRALVDRVLADKVLAKQGGLVVEVFRDNAIGRRFYERYGFRERDTFVHEASGEVTLRMALDPQ